MRIVVVLVVLLIPLESMKVDVETLLPERAPLENDMDDDEEEKPSVEEKPRNDGLKKSSRADPPPPKCRKTS